VLLNKIYK